jgi:glycosyltransferase involved in cell wall biosynthesis
MNPINSIIRQATKIASSQYHILSSVTHESNGANLAKTNSIFYMYQTKDMVHWDTGNRPLPKNIILLNESLGDKQIPQDIELDIVLFQQTFSQYQALYPIAKRMGLPIIRYEHCTTMPHWSKNQILQMKQMRGDINVFISEQNRDAWGFTEDESIVIRHGINTNIFKPNSNTPKVKTCLSIANDYKNRGHILGYDILQRVTNGLPLKIKGNTPGVSTPTTSVEELVSEYQSAQVFLSPTRLSPLPCVTMEAASCGLPIVALNNNLLPALVQHGVNGFLTNDENEFRKYTKMLLDDPAMAAEMGQKGREIIIKEFSLDKFINEWNQVFEMAANKVFTG